VHELDRLDHLAHKICSDRLDESLVWLLLEELVQLATRRKLKDQVHTLVVCEESVHLKNVFVLPKVAVDLDFAAQLLFVSILNQLGLIQNLDRD